MTHNLSVGPVPKHKGVWLGIQEGTLWRPLAKFHSDAAADEFLSIMRAAGIKGDNDDQPQ